MINYSITITNTQYGRFINIIRRPAMAKTVVESDGTVYEEYSWPLAWGCYIVVGFALMLVLAGIVLAVILMH